MAVFIEFGSVAVLAAAWVLLVILLGESRPESVDWPAHRPHDQR
jgi:hypothetical protein